MKKLKNEHISLKPEERLYQVEHPVIGLTGGIATGKSTVAKLFEADGIPVISADALVKTVYTKDETVAFIKENWLDALVDGSIDFKILREIAFSEDSNREKIEEFIYARMPEAFKEHYSKIDEPTLLVYDVPLLYEKNLTPLVDVNVCVYAPRELQIQRLKERDSIDADLAKKILGTQMDIEEKKEAADYFIDNSKDLEELDKKFKKFLNKIV